MAEPAPRPADETEMVGLICAILRGENAAVLQDFGALPWRLFLSLSEYHGVTALLYEKLQAVTAWPGELIETLRERALAQAVWEMRHQQAIGRAIAALRADGIEPVIFKGTALAYGLYANSVWRMRGDTDMIVAPEDGRSAGAALAEAGFVRQPAAGGELVSTQDSYILELPGAGPQAIDLHRRINNSELLSRLFSHAELRAAARPLPALCAGAWAAGPVHALLLAAMHRATHIHNPYYVEGVAHYGGDRLIWHYDVHLLAQSFTPADWQALVGLAREKGLGEISREALDRAAACFGTPVPDVVRAGLDVTGERVAAYLKAGHVRQNWMDFCAIAGWADKVRFLRELVFPPSSYMLAKYAPARPRALPWLYARRALEGVVKRLGRGW